MPKIKPYISAALDIFCLAYLCLYRFLKATWTEKPSRKRKIHNLGFTILSIISTIDLIYCAIGIEYAYINNFLRPIIVILFFSSIRVNLMLIWHDFRDSLLILISIFAFIMFFSALGLFIFQGTFTGSQDFYNFGASYYSLVMLLTDTNFPDVMLLSYYSNTWYTLYFIIFVICGVFFLSNVLLAVIFDNYKRRIELNSVIRVGSRR